MAQFVEEITRRTARVRSASLRLQDVERAYK